MLSKHYIRTQYNTALTCFQSSALSYFYFDKKAMSTVINYSGDYSSLVKTLYVIKFVNDDLAFPQASLVEIRRILNPLN